MKNHIITLLFSLVIISTGVCQVENNFVIFPVTGIWAGLLPCADCESISYRLNLKKNNTYSDKIVYNGKETDNVYSGGKWKLLNDTTIKLTSKDGVNTVYRKRFYELIMLDDKGNEMRGPLPEMFHLRRISKGNSNDNILKPLNPDRWSDKRRNGVYFIAMGNEPSWSVDITKQSIKFTSLTEVTEITTGTPETVKIMDVAGKSFIGNSDSAVVNVSIFKQDCIDNMSGERFFYSVTVDISFKNGSASRFFKGCGKYLNDPLINKIWMLSRLNGEVISVAEEKVKIPSMKFSIDEGKVSGNAGCNSYNGTVEGLGNQIRFGYDFAMTRMMCPDMETEKKFIETIKGKTVDYEASEDKLLLKEGDATIMEFSKSKEQN